MQQAKWRDAGLELAHARRALGLTHDALSDDTGVPADTLYRWELQGVPYGAIPRAVPVFQRLGLELVNEIRPRHAATRKRRRKGAHRGQA